MGDGRELTIDELSERTGVPVRTIRYYIAERLLPGPGTRGMAAAYGEDHLVRLQFIRRLAESGLSLAEMKTRRLTDLPLEEVKALLAEDRRDEEPVKQDGPELAPKAYVSALLSQARRARSLAEGTTTAPEPESPGHAEAAGPVSGLTGRSSAQAGGSGSAFPSQAGASPTGGDAWRRFELMDGVELHVREDVLRREGQTIFGRLNSLLSLFRRTRR